MCEGVQRTSRQIPDKKAVMGCCAEAQVKAGKLGKKC